MPVVPVHTCDDLAFKRRQQVNEIVGNEIDVVSLSPILLRDVSGVESLVGPANAVKFVAHEDDLDVWDACVLTDELAD